MAKARKAEALYWTLVIVVERSQKPVFPHQATAMVLVAEGITGLSQYMDFPCQEKSAPGLHTGGRPGSSSPPFQPTHWQSNGKFWDQ